MARQEKYRAAEDSFLSWAQPMFVRCTVPFGHYSNTLERKKMQIDELEFDEGRAEVNFSDDTGLSILNADRQDVLDNHWSPRAHLWTSIQADDGTYEIAPLVAGDPIGTLRIPEFADYETLDSDGAYIYAYVPEQVVIDYINERLPDGESN
jgi:hypothetical protein